MAHKEITERYSGWRLLILGSSYVGVPQGTVLGPLMFLIFVNDMQDDLECSLRLFADDALLYHTISQESDTLILQRDLGKLGLWAKK